MLLVVPMAFTNIQQHGPSVQLTLHVKTQVLQLIYRFLRFLEHPQTFPISHKWLFPVWTSGNTLRLQVLAIPWLQALQVPVSGENCTM